MDDPSLLYEIWFSENLSDWGSTPAWSGVGYGPGEVTLDRGYARWFLKLSVRHTSN